MEKGESYEKVKKVYSVNIVYFALAKGLDKAKTSLKQNIDIATISTITGLSVKEIEKLTR